MNTKKIYPRFVFSVDESSGTISFEDRRSFDTYILRNFSGKKGQIIAMPYRKYRRRSSGQEDEEGNQNGYYWGVVLAILGDEMGITDDEVHDMMRMKFLKIGKEVNGRRYETARSTADLTTVEFEQYLQEIRTWAGTPGEISEEGVMIPLPNEVVLDGELG